MRNVAMTVGSDVAGDACVYFNIHDEDGNHIRYATEQEIERYLCKLSEANAEPTLEGLGVDEDEDDDTAHVCGDSCRSNGCSERFKAVSHV